MARCSVSMVEIPTGPEAVVEAAGLYCFLGQGIEKCYDEVTKQEFWR